MHEDDGQAGNQGEAMAKREHLERMGLAHEVDPGVIIIEHISGYRTKWLHVFGGPWWRKVSSDAL
jgi:hypothetical protein